MFTMRSPHAAVDIIQNTLSVLVLKSTDGVISCAFWHQQAITDDTTLDRKLPCQSIMTMMQYRAIHYQQITQQASFKQVQESVQEKFGGDSTDNNLQIDCQSSAASTSVISGHRSQIAQLQESFSFIPKPLSVIEPRCQAIVRAANYLLPSIWPKEFCQKPGSDWFIVELAQPLSVAIRCSFGEPIERQFIALADIPQLVSDNVCLVLYFGDAALQQALQQQTRSPLLTPLTVPAKLQQQLPMLKDNQYLPLLGVALRGFSKWHR